MRILLRAEVNISVKFVNLENSVKNFLHSFEEFLNQRLEYKEAHSECTA